MQALSMSEETKLGNGDQEAIERGFKAKSLLENELFNEVLARLEASYLKNWKCAKTVEHREDMHRYVSLLICFKGDLQSMATTGELTKKRVAELEQTRKLSRSLW